jgi:hypothetical protein
MQLIVALVLAVLAGVCGGFVAGWQYGAADCGREQAQRAGAVAVAKEKVRAGDARQVARLATDNAARAAQTEGVRRELEQSLHGGVAERECLPADVLRIVNENRAGGVPAAGPGADAALPAATEARGREGGDGGAGAGR